MNNNNMNNNNMNNINPVIGENNLPEYISVISASRCARIRIEDIEVIEQEGRRLHVITADREYCFYESMKEVIMCLYGRAFYRPVKGLIINFSHVKEISGNAVTFYSGHVVTMGKNSITRTRASFKKFLMRYPPYSMVDINPAAMQVAENNLINEPQPEKKRPYAKAEKERDTNLTNTSSTPGEGADAANQTGSKSSQSFTQTEVKNAPQSDSPAIIKHVQPRQIKHTARRLPYKQASVEADIPAKREADEALLLNKCTE